MCSATGWRIEALTTSRLRCKYLSILRIEERFRSSAHFALKQQAAPRAAGRFQVWPNNAELYGQTHLTDLGDIGLSAVCGDDRDKGGSCAEYHSRDAIFGHRAAHRDLTGLRDDPRSPRGAEPVRGS